MLIHLAVYLPIDCPLLFLIKLCSECSAVKFIYHFYRHTSSRDGLRPICKPCWNASQRSKHAENPERRRALDRERYAENPEPIKFRSAQRYQENRDSILAKQQLDRSLNIELARKKDRDWYARQAIPQRLRKKVWRTNNPEKQFLINRNAYQRHRPTRLKQKAIYRRTHAPQIYLLNLKRRMLVNQVPVIDTFTLEEIGTRDNWKCHICGKKVARRDASIDHHFPISQPGAIHGSQYVSLAHRACNSRRGPGRLPAQLLLFGKFPNPLPPKD